MRALKPLVFLFLTLSLAFSSCRSDDMMPGDALGYIPEKVASVTAINLQRLLDKAAFEQVKTMDFYRDFVREVGENNAAFAKVLEDPARAGVDLAQNAYLSMELDTSKGGGFVAILFAIKDQVAFEQTLDALDLKYVPASQDPGFVQGKSSALLWNDGIGILGLGHSDNVEAKATAYLHTDKDRSIGRNKNLRKALSRDFDVLNWISSDAFVEIFNLEEMGKMARFSAEDLRENYLQSVLNFEDGQIKAETQYFLQPKLSGDLALVLNKKVKTDFSEKIPRENLLFYSNLGIRPKGINQLLIEYHIKGMSGQPLDEYGIAFEDLIEAFSGDAAMAVYMKKERILNFPSFLLALDFDSRKHLDKILDAAQQAKVLRKVENDRYQLLRQEQVDSVAVTEDRVEAELLIKDGLLYLSDQPERISLLQSGKFSTDSPLLKNMTDLVAKHAFVTLVDIAGLKHIIDDFTDMPMNSIEVTAGRNSAAYTVKMANETDNSLKQFFQWMNEKYREEQLRKQETKDEKI